MIDTSFEPLGPIESRGSSSNPSKHYPLVNRMMHSQNAQTRKLSYTLVALVAAIYENSVIDINMKMDYQ